MNWDVVPPSERGSEVSNISLVVRKDPAKLFRKTDVDKCFIINSAGMLPPDWNETSKGFNVIQVLQ